jgi:hypothetical protein
VPYSRVWTKNNPPGSQAANTADDELRNLREDIEERMSELVDGWTTASPTDPVVPKAFDLGKRARVFRNATQSIPHNVFTAILWDSETFDVGGMHDAIGPTRLVIPLVGSGDSARGVYVIHAHVLFEGIADTSGLREIAVRKTGVATNLAENFVRASVGGVEHLDIMHVAGSPLMLDFFEVYVRQTSGSPLNIGGGTNPSATTYAEIFQVV